MSTVWDRATWGAFNALLDEHLEDVLISLAKTDFIEGRIDIHQLEARIAEVLAREARMAKTEKPTPATIEECDAKLAEPGQSGELRDKWLDVRFKLMQGGGESDEDECLPPAA